MTEATVILNTLPPLGFIDGLGGPEMLLVLVIVLLLFGGDKLPEFARGMGKTMRELKKAASGVEDEFRRAMDEDERKKAAAFDPAVSATPGTETGSTPPPAEGAPAEAGPVSPAAEATPTGTAGETTPPPAPTPAKRVIASDDCP
jgi:TatA/E family protein of Tat protein translocase